MLTNKTTKTRLGKPINKLNKFTEMETTEYNISEYTFNDGATMQSYFEKYIKKYGMIGDEKKLKELKDTCLFRCSDQDFD